ncbi:MAG: hypothetical protein AB2421_10830 [Thermotaleaceae bacterium]
MEQPMVHNYKMFFLHPFIYEDLRHLQILKSLLFHQSQWQLKVYRQGCEAHRLRTEYFLPHIIKFLFPTMYCKTMEYNKIEQRDIRVLQELTSLDFSLKESNLEKYKHFSLKNQDSIYDLTFENINLKIFHGGVGFLFFQVAIHQESLTLNDIIMVNQLMRPIHPLYQGFSMPVLTFHETLAPIAMRDLLEILLSEIHEVNGYPNTYNIYMDRLLPYTYVCLKKTSLKNTQIYQRLDLLEALRSLNLYNPNKDSSYVLSHQEQEKIYYFRHKSSAYGFSKEGGVLLAIDKDSSDEVILPNTENAYIPSYFSTYYLDMLILALYQRISLINYCRKLSMIKSILNDKNQIERIRFDILKFTNTAWFTQITNSELGMGIWKHWFMLFENEVLYGEVKQGLDELDDFLESKRQNRFSLKLGIVTALTIPPTLIFGYVGNRFDEIRFIDLIHPRFVISSFLIFIGMVGLLFLVDRFYSRPYK